jgi:hypothetical protein
MTRHSDQLEARMQSKVPVNLIITWYSDQLLSQMQSRVARILKMTRHSDQLVAQMRSRVVLEPFGQCAKSSRLSQASGRLIMIHEKTTVHFVTGASGAFMIAQRDCPTDKAIHTKIFRCHYIQI